MAALSVDLRRRIVAYYRAQSEATYTSTAERFMVGVASVSRVLRLQRETGDVRDRPRQKRSRYKVNEGWLREHVEAHPDARLRDRAEAFAQAFGKTVSEPGLWYALRALGYTHKKRPFTRKSKTRSASAANVRRSSPTSPR
jgi:transposase